MSRRLGTVERAFILARSGRSKTVDEIRRILKFEHYGDWQYQLSGALIRRQLNAAIAQARSSKIAACGEPGARTKDTPMQGQVR
jgi:hypothetical protein